MTPEDFIVGWICALPIELAAVAEMMGEEFADLPSYLTDSNIYSFGRIGNHNVVAACLLVRWGQTQQLLWPVK